MKQALKQGVMEDNFKKQLQDKINQQEAEIIKLKSELRAFKKESSLSFFDLLNNYFVNMPGYVYWKNKDSVYMGCNNNLAKICKLQNPSEIIGRRDEQFEWGNKLSKKFIEDDIYVIHTGKEHSSVYELPIKRNDGNNIWVCTNKIPLIVNHELIGVIGIALDITDYKIEYKQAILDKEFIEDIIYNLPGLVYWKNKKSQYVGFNRNVVSLSGLDRNQLSGKTDLDLKWGAKEAERFIEDDKKVMETGEVLITENEIPIKRADGKFITVKTEKSQLKSRNGDVVGVLGVAIDITDQKELEKKLILEKDRSEQANLIKTEFMRNMEHDIRTPFSGVLSMAHYLWEIEQDEKKKEYLNDITLCAKELLDYCNGILEFSQIESGKLPILNKKFDLKELINSVIRTELPAAKDKGLELKMSYTLETPTILVGDPYRTHRILINLISNSIKFTQEGYVDLKISLIKKTEQTALIRFIVADTGIGIPTDKQEYIFEKFSRLSLSNKGLYKGIGLGLRVVKQFMHEIDGEIDLISEVGKGTQFICTIYFTLPLTNDFIVPME